MTRLLEQAVATVSTFPDDVQDELAHMLLQCIGAESPPYELTPEEAADVAASMAEAARGEFATDDEVRAMWAKHGR
jgi:predicted transcriptional regulator